MTKKCFRTTIQKKQNLNVNNLLSKLNYCDIAIGNIFLRIYVFQRLDCKMRCYNKIS